MTKPDETSYRAEELDRRIGLLAGKASSLRRTLRLERFLSLGGSDHLKRLDQKVEALSRDLRDLRGSCSALVSQLEEGERSAPVGGGRARNRRLGSRVSLRYLARRVVQRTLSGVQSIAEWILAKVISKSEARVLDWSRWTQHALPEIVPFLDLDRWSSAMLDSIRARLRQQTLPAAEWIEGSALQKSFELCGADGQRRSEVTSPGSLANVDYLWTVGREIIEEPLTLLEGMRLALALESIDVLVCGTARDRGRVMRRNLWSADNIQGELPVDGKVTRQLELASGAYQDETVRGIQPSADVQLASSLGGISPTNESAHDEVLSSGPTTLLLLEAPLVAGVDRWVADLLRAQGSRRYIVVAPPGGSELADRRRRELGRISPWVFPTDWFTIETRPELIRSLARRWKVDSLLVVGADERDSWGVAEEGFLPGLRRIALPLSDSHQTLAAAARYDGALTVSDVQTRRLERIGGENSSTHRIVPRSATRAWSVVSREDLGLEPSSTVVTMVADWVCEERPEDFLALADRLKSHEEFRFLLIGEGPLASHLVDLARYLGLENLEMAARNRPDSDWLAATDIACTTSEGEGFPYFVLDAREMGVPVVAAASSGLVEMQDPGLTLHRPGDLEALAQSLLASRATKDDIPRRPEVEGSESPPWSEIADFLGR